MTRQPDNGTYAEDNGPHRRIQAILGRWRSDAEAECLNETFGVMSVSQVAWAWAY